MKKMKKVMALLLSLVMVLAMSIATFAGEGSTGSSTTYTITAPSGSHQYEIYQIFTGDLHERTLSNVKWGENGIGTKGEAVDQTVISALTAVNNTTTSDTDKLKVIENYANLTSTPKGIVTNGGTYNAEAGYYLIKDTDGSVSGKDAYTLYIVEVVGNVTITPKSDVPKFEKKIKDTNDTTGETSGWQDSADYDIGDQVPFRLQGTVASNYAEYTGKYYFAFHDTEEPGLTFNKGSVKAYVENEGAKRTEISTDQYTIVYPGPTDGHTFDVIFADLKQVTGVKAGSKIVVEYTSKLNEKAVIGNQGNENTAHLEFSNNPNEEQKGDEKPSTGETPDDTVIVFTYKVVANKINENNGALKGAAFKLEKKTKEEGYKLVRLVNATENNGKYTIVDADMTSFEWIGVDDGEYRLTEIITPEGYNTIAPIEFTVTAGHKAEFTFGDRTKVLETLTGGDKVSGDVTTGQLITAVVNKKGSSLPSTGGMGTTIFYVVGSILVLGAAILLITKKRMSAR